MPSYRLFGLTLDSHIVLPNAPHSLEPPDVVIARRHEAPAGSQPPAGTVIARQTVGDAYASCLLRRPDGRYALWLHTTAVFDLDLESGQVECTWDPAADVSMLPILVTGMVLSAYLLLKGELLLHASAVDIAALDGSVALLGSSGMGKSTLATLLANDGHPLVADDVLRVVRQPGGWASLRGTTETRLRPKAFDLATGAAARPTVDGRRAVSFPMTDRDPVLRAVIIPGPDPGARDVELTRLSVKDALTAMIRNPRIVGWVDAATSVPTFQAMAAFAREVPIFASRIPWGPPFSPNLAQSLLDAVADQLASSAGSPGGAAGV